MNTATSVVLSPDTLDILKSFARQNQNLYYDTANGQTVCTINASNSVIATATLPEGFSQSFGIFDLNRFLSVANLFDNPAIEFTEDGKSAYLSDSGKPAAKVRYYFSDPENLKLPKPLKNLNPQYVVNFDMTGVELKEIFDAANILQTKTFTVSSTETPNTIQIRVHNEGNKTAESYCVDVPVHTATGTFEFNISIENLKLIPGDYNVRIATAKFSTWDCTTKAVSYMIALEQNSVYKAS